MSVHRHVDGPELRHQMRAMLKEEPTGRYIPTVHAIYEAFARGEVADILDRLADDLEWEPEAIDLNWWPSYATLGRLFRVVALDQRGHGRGIEAGLPFRLEACADDVAVLAGAPGIERMIPVLHGSPPTVGVHYSVNAVGSRTVDAPRPEW